MITRTAANLLRIGLVAAALAPGASLAEVRIESLDLTGRIQDENIIFTLTVEAESDARKATLDLVGGAVALMAENTSRHVSIAREADRLTAVLSRKGSHHVEIEFASLVSTNVEWRTTSFTLPEAIVRRLSVQADDAEFEIAFPGALRVHREEAGEGMTRIEAFLPGAAPFVVQWQPRVRDLEGALVASCDATVIANATVGAVHLDSTVRYTVAQGEMRTLRFDVPEPLRITRIDGADILAWRLESDGGNGRVLVVELNRATVDAYALRIQAERLLPDFPCTIDLPYVTPADVLRTSGFLYLGTDQAIKLAVDGAQGVSQIDPAAFPRHDPVGDRPCVLPGQSVFAYQFANLPVRLDVSADNIVPTVRVEEQLTLSVEDRDARLDAIVNLEVRDAPLRELSVTWPAGWTLVQLEGSAVRDYTARGEGGTQDVTVLFGDGVQGRSQLSLRLERSLEGDGQLAAPTLRVAGARSERGFIVLHSETGIRLKPDRVDGLREVSPGTLPIAAGSAQTAFRFKTADWALSLNVEQTDAAIYAELFHLVSLGDEALYGSCSITYVVEGSPVRSLALTIPGEFENVDFVGRDVRNWVQEGETWTIEFQEKIFGDYTLLVTYDRRLAAEGESVFAGGIATLGTDSETGYIAVAGKANLAIDQVLDRDDAVLPLERKELPEAYRLLINDPVLRAYRYVASPHQVHMALKRFPTGRLLSAVADHTSLSSRVSKEGEVVTTARYFVKNMSDQYLTLSLPATANLWAVRVDDREVQPLRGVGAGDILVPLQRHPDPNRPSHVEVEYAEALDALGWMNQLHLTAPRCLSQSVFSQWQISIPEQFAMARTGGTLAADLRPADTGLHSIVDRLRAAYTLLWTRAPLAPAILLGGLLLIYLGEMFLRQGRVVYRSIVVLGCAGLLIAGQVNPPEVIQCFTQPNHKVQVPTTESFSRVVNLANGDLSIALRIAPAWVGATGSLRGAVLSLVAGMAWLAWSHRRGWKAGWVSALCGAMVVWGLAQLAITAQVLFFVLVAGLPVFAGLLGWRVSRRLGERRRARVVSTAPEPPPLITPEPLGAPDGSAGFVTLRGFVLLLGVGIAASTMASDVVQQVECFVVRPPVETLRADHIEVTIDAPQPDTDGEEVAAMTLVVTLDVAAEGTMPILLSPLVVKDFRSSSDRVRLLSTQGGYDIEVERSGKYELRLDVLAPVCHDRGAWTMPLFLPTHIRHDIRLRVPARDFEVSSPTAVFRQTMENDDGIEVRILLSSEGMTELTWRPRERRTRMEKAVVFGEVTSLATLDRGVIHLVHQVDYEIAQGEVQAFALTIPEGMSITSVHNELLSTWRFDPDTRQLEMVLRRPVSGSVQLMVMGQMARDRLPYHATIGIPALADVEHQRGQVGLAVRNGVQCHPESPDNLVPINLADFNSPQPQSGQLAFAGGELTRTYRYQSVPALIEVEAVAVLPEFRVQEAARLDLADDRVLLASDIGLTINRAGVFSVSIRIPDDFDIESLEGEGVSHWDERRPGESTVTVHFLKQTTGGVMLNLVLVRSEKRLPDRMDVPRVEVVGAVKHRGTLAITAERGLRLLTEVRDGVTELHPRELGITTPHALAYRILRPAYRVTLGLDHLAATVKAQVLQDLSLSEGMLSASCRIRYTIAHAGIKRLRLKAPHPGVALNIQGTDVARTREVDAEKGIWQVDLRNKTEQHYLLDVRYQHSVPPHADMIRIDPLQTLDTNAQSGYVTVRAGGRLRVQVRETGPGLRAVDARNIPANLAMRDQSDAILCYQSISGEYHLLLDMERHDTAEVLPASVSGVQLASMMSADGQMVTRARLQMRTGELRFLRTALPENSHLWAAFVGGQPVTPLLEQKWLMVPLDVVAPGEETDIEIIYGGAHRKSRWSRRMAVAGPSFDLPLNDIEWTLFVPSQYGYRFRDGTLQPVEDRPWAARVLHFDARLYEEQSRAAQAQSLERAERELKKGEQFAKEGKQRQARKAFESAMLNSVGAGSFNEDARVQYENLARRQAIVGLVNRRNQLKMSNNLGDLPQAQQRDEYRDGNWTEEYGFQVEQSLDAKDNDSLTRVAEKLLEQQTAASGQAPAIRITLPVHGQALDFHRALQIERMAPMTVELVRSKKEKRGNWMAAALFGLTAVGWRTGQVAWRRSRDVDEPSALS